MDSFIGTIKSLQMVHNENFHIQNMFSYFKYPKHIPCPRQTPTALALEYTDITNILKEKNGQ
jgi:hypothetical protein